MHDYLFSADPVRLAFILGIIASMLYYERRQITTGSIVVPGYIALFVMQPSVIAVTFANALLCYWLINRVLSRRVLLYGRSKFTVLAITSMAIQALMLKLSPSGAWLWESDIPILVGIGYVVPALIAHDMARQGIRKTIVAVLTTGMLVVVPVVLALLFISNVQADSVLVSFESVLLPPDWIPFAVVLSAAASWGLLSNYGLRQGGFVGGAFVGLLWANPGQVGYVMVIAVITWAIVTRLLMPHIILFGRRKFATMLMIAALLSWIGMWIGTRYFGLNPGAYVTITAIPLTPLFVPGLLANDMERASPPRVVVGSTLGALFVIPTTMLVMELSGARNVGDSGTLALASAATTAIIFAPQLAQIAVWCYHRLTPIAADFAYQVLGHEPEPAYANTGRRSSRTS